MTAAAAPVTSPALSTVDRRFTAVDGLRGIAILFVMQYHFWGNAYGLFGIERTREVDEWSSKVFSFGWMSVDMFFVLSGFLITGILLDVKGRSGFFRNFYARRSLRIFPVYYFYLAFVIFLIPLVPFLDDGIGIIAQPERVREDQFWYWAYLLNVATSVTSIDVNPPVVHLHFWTLAVEEQFYLMWPFIVLALGRTQLAWTCAVMIVGAFLFRVAILEGFASDIFSPNAARVLMPAKMDTLALGGLIAIAMRRDELRSFAKYAPAVLAASVAVLLVLIVRNKGLDYQDVDTARWGFTAIGFAFAAILVLVLRLPQTALAHRAITHPVFMECGKYSYAMYVFHLLISFELARQVYVHNWAPTLAGSQTPFNIIFSAVATALTFAAGWISWRVLEEPILTQKRRFMYGPRPSAQAAPAAAAPAPGARAEP